MRRVGLRIFSGVLLIGSVAYGQSLGDVARENREKKQANAASASGSSKPKPKVITDDNLPARVVASSSETERDIKPVATAGGQSAGRLSAEEWKSRILAQKNAIAAQQAQIDKLNESIRCVTASLYTNGIQHNENQAKKQESVAQMQQQLEEQKKTLAQMQEAARQAGMGSAVYDP
ncbi:MAG TPA: hypothetical protein VK828_13935 [Terriglobales bacterium]|jgi:hypothetical protein|nr:hypothetical protein [Terriglobales bacterium]